MRPVSSRSAAWVAPISRGSSHDSPYSAGRPSWGVAVVSLAAADGDAQVAVARQHEADAGAGAVDPGDHRHPQAEVPGEVVVPLGPHAVARRGRLGRQARGRRRPVRRGRPGPGCRRRRVNVSPAPVTTTQRTSGSASSAAMPRRYSACMRPVQALWRWGRSIVTVATPVGRRRRSTALIPRVRPAPPAPVRAGTRGGRAATGRAGCSCSGEPSMRLTCRPAAAATAAGAHESHSYMPPAWA